MKRILVVDDEPDIRMTLRLILEMSGYAIVEAADGREAIDRARERPDLILLDIRLPDIDGLEVLQTLKAQTELATIPVICLSAHSSPHTVQRSLELGATAYVSKPFDFDELRKVVAKATAMPPGASRAG